MAEADYRVRATLEWLEDSGPLLVDMDLIVLRHHPETTEVECVYDEGSFHLHPRAVAYASWFLLRATAPGAKVTIKCRCDEFASRHL